MILVSWSCNDNTVRQDGYYEVFGGRGRGVRLAGSASKLSNQMPELSHYRIDYEVLNETIAKLLTA